MGIDWILEFEIKAKCKTTKARSSLLKLHHGIVPTPIFMPVGTRGAMKGLTTKQLDDIGIPIILGNTYHLGSKPGINVLEKAGGLHKFMNWNKAILTDSGGFQMVSLSKFSKVTENGVKFDHPVDGSTMMLTPEQSMLIQKSIHSDIVMQLDDVVSSLTTGNRVEEAMERSVRWLDRAIECFENGTNQNLFAIIQGGLDTNLRNKCLKKMVNKNIAGFAIGGLSGGEDKHSFWTVIKQCVDSLPENKPRYVMGVGYAPDIVVCSALGCDMFDCVYPTRTARFGTALTFKDGHLRLKSLEFKDDHRPIECDCSCYTCTNYSRAYINNQLCYNNSALSLLTIHNLFYQHRLMKEIRNSIENETFPLFVKKFMINYYPDGIPEWIKNALKSVDIEI